LLKQSGDEPAKVRRPQHRLLFARTRQAAEAGVSPELPGGGFIQGYNT
jgi:hypothetical protein